MLPVSALRVGSPGGVPITGCQVTLRIDMWMSCCAVSKSIRSTDLYRMTLYRSAKASKAKTEV